MSLAEAAGLLSGFFLHLAVARALGPDDYGRYACLALLQLTLIILLGGIPQAIRQLVGVNPANLPEAVRWVVRVQIPLVALVVVSIGISAGTIVRLCGDEGLRRPLWVLCVDAFFLCGLMEPGILLLNRAGCYVRQACVMALYFLGRLAAAAAIAVLTGNLYQVMIALAFAFGLATVPALLWVADIRLRAADETDDDFGARAATWVKYAT